MKNNNIALLINEEIEYPNEYKIHLAKDIDEIEDASCDDIYLGDTLDYVPINDSVMFLQKAVKKLKVSACLHIKAPDILQLCWYTVKMNLDLPKLRYILFGNKREHCLSLDECLTIITDVDNVDVESTTYCNIYEYAITIKKQTLEVLSNNEQEKTVD